MSFLSCSQKKQVGLEPHLVEFKVIKREAITSKMCFKFSLWWFCPTLTHFCLYLNSDLICCGLKREKKHLNYHYVVISCRMLFLMSSSNNSTENSEIEKKVFAVNVPLEDHVRLHIFCYPCHLIALIIWGLHIKVVSLHAKSQPAHWHWSHHLIEIFAIQSFQMSSDEHLS